MYTAYLISDKDRARMEKLFPPKYSKFIGHHITEQFGVPASASAPDMPEHVFVLGEADSGDGLQALIVGVNGNVNRPDGKIYHVTWSLDPDKYKPKDSNTLIELHGFERIRGIIAIDVQPVVLK